MRQSLYIGVVMTGTFAVSLIVLTRGQSDQFAPALPTKPAPGRWTPAPKQAPVIRPDDRVTAAMAPETAVMPGPTSSTAPAPTQTEAAPDLPVALQIMYRHRLNSIIANVSNVSGDALSLEASIVRDGSQVASLKFDLPPLGIKTLGSADGVDMHSADRFVLRSPHFRERSETVP